MSNPLLTSDEARALDIQAAREINSEVRRRGRPPGSSRKRRTAADALTDLPADVLNANARYDPKGPW